ncbi:hypothetical protein [Aromatoleum aromaticum]|uniref:Secretion system X translation initiation factor n=1 Tax=Aromatoleum aromaticum (strain DSM 19018 / LMG 30748 / EbN1) TaxID=76114 RepID=Q5P7D1_AROAE|nr:hypothetical protein [Aromatoleum aromaticum]NMG53683.1 hypothetical protein [Aromatoleum aromaticum]CAI06780.1 hypothetical protein ebA1237 [Aromatoleum aromaticum EbN1]
MSRDRRRRLFIGAALVATLAATWWAALIDDEIGLPVDEDPLVRDGSRTPATTRRARAPQPMPSLDGLSVERAPLPDVAADILPPTQLHPPAELATPSPAPAVPDAPPLPFRFVGALEENGGLTAFLLEGEQLRVVRAHDTIDERYRVERVTTAFIEFTYLPRRMRQVLNVSGSS